MPRLLDLEMSGGKVALRLVLAAVFGGLAFIVFYYIPSALGAFLAQAAGSGGSSASNIASALINPQLPTLGLAIAVLVFLGVMLMGTKAYGPALIVIGLAFVAYVYTVFQGGIINLTVPKGVQYSASGNVAIDVALLMYLFMLGPILTILKGVVIVVIKPAGSQQAPQAS